MILHLCPACGAEVESPESLAGKSTDCPLCTAELHVPAAEVGKAATNADDDVQSLYDAALGETAPTVAPIPDATTAAKKVSTDQMLLNQRRNEFIFPKGCSKCGKEGDDKWWRLQTSRAIGSSVQTLDIRVPICRSCKASLIQAALVHLAIGLAIGAAIYFIPTLLWGQAWSLQTKAFLIAGSLLTSIIVYKVLGTVRGTEFARIEKTGLTLAFANAAYQGAFDRLNKPVRRAQVHLLNLGQQRWGPAPQEVERRIHTINDLERLGNLIARISWKKSWQDVDRD
ncbi:MAG TPA: hypothetical protein VE988_24040 [Gemmataceae bacterium]|nr:hypothetical protein [Gemmataceae bacterium]